MPTRSQCGAPHRVVVGGGIAGCTRPDRRRERRREKNQRFAVRVLEALAPFERHTTALLE
jgi:hypothetical protein